MIKTMMLKTLRESRGVPYQVVATPQAEAERRIRCGEWKRDMRRILIDALTADDRVIQGASGGFGVVTKEIVHRVGPKGHVAVYEPARQMQRYMPRDANVYLERTCLSDHSGGAHLGVPSGEPWRSQLTRDIGDEPVQAVSTRIALKEHRADVLVLDVEGAERNIICETTMPHQVREVIVEIHDRLDTPDMNAAMERQGYDLRRLTSEDAWDSVTAWWSR